MRYSKHIVFLIVVNLIIVSLSIFTGNLTRKLELTNKTIIENIDKEKNQLQINKIEFSFYNNSDYIKKLHNIYFPFVEYNPETQIILLSDISRSKIESLIFVNSN